MIDVYQANCSTCNASFKVKYGSITKTQNVEVYGCTNCKILFSLSNLEKLACPECGTDDLLRYNFHKEENISYYEKMLDKGLLTKEKYDMLIEYWEKMECKKCPVCGKNTLNWIILEEPS